MVYTVFSINYCFVISIKLLFHFRMSYLPFALQLNKYILTFTERFWATFLFFYIVKLNTFKMMVNTRWWWKLFYHLKIKEPWFFLNSRLFLFYSLTYKNITFLEKAYVCILMYQYVFYICIKLYQNWLGYQILTEFVF
jgi:hypothetical protein